MCCVSHVYSLMLNFSFTYWDKEVLAHDFQVDIEFNSIHHLIFQNTTESLSLIAALSNPRQSSTINGLTTLIRYPDEYQE